MGIMSKLLKCEHDYQVVIFYMTITENCNKYHYLVVMFFTE